MTFGKNITEANCYDYHNEHHYRGAGVCVRWDSAACGTQVDTKHLVMTGKEHRLPRAGFFFSPLSSPYSSTCQSLSPFFSFSRETGNRNYPHVICGLLSYRNVKRHASLAGLFSAVEYQYGTFRGFKCFLVGGIRCKFPPFKAVKVST